MEESDKMHRKKIFNLIYIDGRASIHPLEVDRKRNMHRKLKNMNYVIEKFE